MITLKRPQYPPSVEEPDIQRILLTARIKRCGVCWRIWPENDFVLEDGQERCPTCVDVRTAVYKAETEAEESAYAASREPKPQISQAPLGWVFPGTIVTITDSSGGRVYEGAPLVLIRNVAKTMLLNGRSFSSADTITSATGMSISVSARTTTLTTLSITAGLTMTPGKYSLTFNGITFRNVFSVG